MEKQCQRGIGSAVVLGGLVQKVVLEQSLEGVGATSPRAVWRETTSATGAEA